MVLQGDFWNGAETVKDRPPRPLVAPFPDRPRQGEGALVKFEVLYYEPTSDRPVRGLPERKPCGWTCDFQDGSRYLRQWGEWIRVWGPAR